MAGLAMVGPGTALAAGMGAAMLVKKLDNKRKNNKKNGKHTTTNRQSSGDSHYEDTKTSMGGLGDHDNETASLLSPRAEV